MFKCEEYKTLDELLQAHLLRLDGIFLASRKTTNLKVALYSLYNFYVEVFCDKKDHEPLFIKSFSYGPNLNVYLDAIKLDELFEQVK